jgi:hypothetical protein
LFFWKDWEQLVSLSIRVSQLVCRDAQVCHQIIVGVLLNLKITKEVCKNSFIFFILVFFTLRCADNLVLKISVQQAEKG